MPSTGGGRVAEQEPTNIVWVKSRESADGGCGVAVEVVQGLVPGRHGHTDAEYVRGGLRAEEGGPLADTGAGDGDFQVARLGKASGRGVGDLRTRAGDQREGRREPVRFQADGG